MAAASCRTCSCFTTGMGWELLGRNVDSNRLYSVVVTRDWWLKVDSREDWDEINEEMALPTRCENKEIALKKNNIRFLDKYEKGSDEEEDCKKRHNRRWSARMLHSMSAVHNTATSRPQTLTSRPVILT